MPAGSADPLVVFPSSTPSPVLRFWPRRAPRLTQYYLYKCLERTLKRTLPHGRDDASAWTAKIIIEQ